MAHCSNTTLDMHQWRLQSPFFPNNGIKGPSYCSFTINMPKLREHRVFQAMNTSGEHHSQNLKPNVIDSTIDDGNKLVGDFNTWKPTISNSGNGRPHEEAVSIVQRSDHPAAIFRSPEKRTLGGYLACRLVQIGITDVFAVPGDSNLTLLDHLIAEPGLNLIGCCNELNAGYAADGYARSRGVGACVLTFTVGGLSALNAIAGAYSENLPLICIVGGPNSNYYGANPCLHHTIGLPDFSQELRCFEPVTCHQVRTDCVGSVTNT